MAERMNTFCRACHESTDASDVAFRIGYESASQFSREYSRMFGFPPIEDINRIRAYDKKYCMNR